MRTKKLNLGCGEFKKKDYINLDIDKFVNPDILHDLNKFPYPFKDNTFDLIEADHVLEHLKEPFKVMNELRRILKPQGKLIIKVPHFSRGFTHPDHKNGFDVQFPLWFNKNFKGGYTGIEFKLVSMKMHWFGQPYLKKTVLSKPVYYSSLAVGEIVSFLASLSPMLCSKVWCFWVGGFDEIEFYFTKL